MDTKILDLIEDCKATSPTGDCDGCGCNEKQCLEALLDEFENKKIENNIN